MKQMLFAKDEKGSNYFEVKAWYKGEREKDEKRKHILHGKSIK